MTATPPIRLIDLGQTGAVRTQAVYHAVARLTSAASPDTVILARPAEPYLCIGYHQSVHDHLDLAACRARDLPIVRRSIGGGTTYLDRDQLFYQFVFHRSRVPATAGRMYAYLLKVPEQTLLSLGFAAALRGEQELEVAGRRIAGIGGGWIGESAVLVGNFLLDFDFAALVRVWASPWPAYRELAAEALADSLITLWSLNPGLAMSRVAEAFSAILPAALKRTVLPGSLTAQDDDLAGSLGLEMTAKSYLEEMGPANGALPRPLKIAAGLTIHAETWTGAGLNYRAALRVRDGIIEEGRIEQQVARGWSTVELPVAGSAYPRWRERLEAAHA